MEEVEDWANKALATDNFKVVSEESFKDLFEKGHCAIYFDEKGDMKTITDNYVMGFDPVAKDGDFKGTFTVYKKGEQLDTGKIVANYEGREI